MARHRSPRGGRAHQGPRLVAIGRTVAGDIVRRVVAPVPTPLRRGAAAVAVTGGALTLVGVAATLPARFEPDVVSAAAVLPAAEAIPADDAAEPADAAKSAPTSPVPLTARAADPTTTQLDTAKLVKAVQLAEKLAAAGKNGDDAKPGDPEDDPKRDGDAAPADGKAAGTGKPAASSNCGLDTSQLGAVRTHVRSAANFLGCRFGEPTVLGVAGRAGSSDHPSGKALDFMVGQATGNALAACALRNQEQLGVSYVIWRQRINFGSGWKPMEDRGGATANHFDHVHVSFQSAPGGRPTAC